MRAAAAAHDDMLTRGEELAARTLRTRCGAALGEAPVLVDDGAALGAEDAAWAALGALERGQLPAAKATLEAMLGRQREDGLLPARLTRRVGLLDGLRRWLGRDVPVRALDQAAFGESLGGSVRGLALLAWAAGEYAVRAGDPEFGRRHVVTLEAAIGWIDGRLGAGLPGPGCEAAYHLAQMALGHLAIERGDAVAGARRWAAAAAAKGRIQDSEREEEAPVADVLLAVYVGACDRATAADALARSEGELAGLVALAATRAGELERAQAELEDAAAQAVDQDGFATFAEAGCFLRALSELRVAAEAAAQAAKARPKRRQYQLSEEEMRILSAC